MKKLFWSASAFAAAALFLPLSLTVQAETKGPVTDDLGVVAIPKDAPIVIGGDSVMHAPDQAFGRASNRVVVVALEDSGNTNSGQTITLVGDEHTFTPPAC